MKAGQNKQIVYYSTTTKDFPSHNQETKIDWISGKFKQSCCWSKSLTLQNIHTAILFQFINSKYIKLHFKKKYLDFIRRMEVSIELSFVSWYQYSLFNIIKPKCDRNCSKTHQRQLLNFNILNSPEVHRRCCWLIWWYDCVSHRLDPHPFQMHQTDIQTRL
jgi:hypothetical protein